MATARAKKFAAGVLRTPFRPKSKPGSIKKKRRRATRSLLSYGSSRGV